MVAPTAGAPIINPITAADPNYLAQVMRAANAQRTAQLLQSQALSPIKYDAKGKISPFQGAAQMLGAYLSQTMADKAIQQQANLQSQAMAQMLRAYGAGSAPQQPMAPGASPQPAPEQPASPEAPAAPQAGPSPQALGAALSPPPAAPQMPQGIPQGAPQGIPQGDNPLNPYGLPPMQMMMASQGDPLALEQIKTMLGNQGLTPQQKEVRDPLYGAMFRGNVQRNGMTDIEKLQDGLAQLPPNDPRRAEIQAAIQKANYIAPIDAKPGTPVIDPRTGQLMAYAPKADAGINVQFGRDGGGALVPTGAGAIPGYAAANAEIAAAEQGAKQGATVFTGVQNGQGAPVSGFGANLFGGAPGGAPQQVPTAPGSAQLSPEVQALIQRDAQENGIANPVANIRGAAPGGVAQLAQGGAPAAQPGVMVGQGTTDAKLNANAGDVIAKLPEATTQAMQSRRGLENALNVLASTKSGPGTEKGFATAALLQNLGLPIAKTETENYQSLQKYLNNALATAAVANGNAGTDARFEQFLHGQPNAALMNKQPLEQAIRYVLSQVDAVPAANQVINAEYQRLRAAGDPNAGYNAQQAWIKQYDPKVFEFSRMTPEERQLFKSRIHPTEQEAFGKKYNAAHGAGWVQ